MNIDIQQMQEEAAQIKINDELIKNDTNLIVLKDGYNVTDLQKYTGFDRGFKGEFTTTILDEWVHYVSSALERSKTPEVYVDADKATVYFDTAENGRPCLRKDKARINLVKTPEYLTFVSKADAKQTQREFAEWIEEWSDCVEFLTEDMEVINLTSAISSIRKIDQKSTTATTSDTQNYKETLSAFDSIEVTFAEATPAFMRFTCIPYEGLAPRVFVARVFVIARENDKPVIGYRWLKQGADFNAIQEEFRDTVKAKLATVAADMPVFAGTFNS